MSDYFYSLEMIVLRDQHDHGGAARVSLLDLLADIADDDNR